MGHGTHRTARGTLPPSLHEVNMPRTPSRPRARSIRLSALPALAVLAGLAAPVAAGPVLATDPVLSPTLSAPAATITFYGRGYGHGLGMSQYGARGRALAGQSAATILAHYYAKTTLGSIGGKTPIRVLLMTGFVPTAATRATVIARGGSFTVDGVAGTWPVGASVTLVRVATPETGWRLRIATATGSVLGQISNPASVRIRPSSSATRLEVTFKGSTYDRYRGTVRLLGSSGGRVSAINELRLETYLRGVVATEMPSRWPTEALRAQGIAARSFAAAHLHPTTGTWDVYDDTRSQTYRGVLAERMTTTAAVTATTGRVLRAGTKVATALFHSSDGGATENNENVYVSATGAKVATPLGYLRGAPDRTASGTAYDAAAPHATWATATYTFAQLSAAFGRDSRTSVGALSGLDLSRRGVSGRLISVTLTGSDGSKTVSGEIFRSVFNRYTPATDPYMWSTLVATAPIP
jgi:SpoIID/LytB domain protein